MRADAAENREKILHAAVSLFAEHGLKVSKRKIAEEAGVGIGTIYRHFPTDADLIEGILDQGSTRLSAIIDSYNRQWNDQASATQAWENCLIEIAHLRIGALLSRPAPNLPADILSRINVEEKIKHISKKYEELLAHGKRWGLMRDDITAFEFHLALSSVSRPWPDRALKLVPEIEEVLTKVIIRGMRP